MTSNEQLAVGGIEVAVVRKDIKNLHLGVYPPDGRVRVAVPAAMSDDAVRAAVASRIGWIRRQRSRYRKQARESQREMVSGETHWLAGRRYRLRVVYAEGRSRITLPNRTTMELRCPPRTDVEGRRHTLDLWYRRQLAAAVPALLDRWAPALGVARPAFGIKRMKTKWGSWSVTTGRIWINTELAKKPPRALEYVVVHELAHVAIRRHGEDFVTLLDRVMPHWRFIRDELGSLPLGHEDWRW